MSSDGVQISGCPERRKQEGDRRCTVSISAAPMVEMGSLMFLQSELSKLGTWGKGGPVAASQRICSEVRWEYKVLE